MIFINVGCTQGQPINTNNLLIIKGSQKISKNIPQVSKSIEPTVAKIIEDTATKLIKSQPPSDITERSIKTDSTIELLNELFLAPIGLREFGDICKDANKALRREILEPLDKMRRFEIGNYKCSIELDVNDKFDTFYLQLNIRF